MGLGFPLNNCVVKGINLPGGFMIPQINQHNSHSMSKCKCFLENRPCVTYDDFQTGYFKCKNAHFPDLSSHGRDHELFYHVVECHSKNCNNPEDCGNCYLFPIVLNGMWGKWTCNRTQHQRLTKNVWIESP